jgi:hypothetical protein
MPSYIIDGNGNVTESDSPSDLVRKQPRKYRPTFAQWLNWISNVDYRFMAHETFPFVGLALKNKITATSSVSYGVSTMGEQGALTRLQILELVNESLNSGGSILPALTLQLTSWCRNVVGSTPYWWDVRKKVQSWVESFLFYHNRTPVLFMTTSLAEYHEQALHRYLEKLYVMLGMPDRAEASSYLGRGQETPPHLAALMANNIRTGALFVDSYAEEKHIAWCLLVLQEALDIDAAFHRGEYASSRGAKHHHSMCFSKVLEELVNGVMNKTKNATSIETLEIIEKEIASDIL